MSDEDYPERRDDETKAEWQARVDAFVAAGGERRGAGCWGCGRVSLMPWCQREQCRKEERNLCAWLLGEPVMTRSDGEAFYETTYVFSNHDPGDEHDPGHVERYRHAAERKLAPV